MNHPLIDALCRGEDRIAYLNILVHIVGGSRLQNSDYEILDSCFEDLLNQIQNVRLKLETADFEVNP